MFQMVNNTGVVFTNEQFATIKNESIACHCNCIMLIQDTANENVFDVLENGNEYGWLFAYDKQGNCTIPQLSEGIY